MARESGTTPGWSHRRKWVWSSPSPRCTEKREDVLAATPPLAAMRFILSRAVARGHGRSLGWWDVSVAFFHATIEEKVFVFAHQRTSGKTRPTGDS